MQGKRGTRKTERQAADTTEDGIFNTRNRHVFGRHGRGLEYRSRGAPAALGQ